MGLVISATEEKKILIKGTDIELPSVYVRLEFAGRADGKSLEVAMSTYASKEAFKMGAAAISTDVPAGNINVQVAENEVQGIESAHKYAKEAYEGLNYETVVDLTA